MSVLRTTGCRVLLLVLLAPGLAVAREPFAGFSAAESAQLGPLRIVVLVDAIDTKAAAFIQKSNAEEFAAAIAADPKLVRSRNSSTGELAVETGLFMMFVSMGGGLIGGVQAMQKEAEAIESLSTPLLERVPALRAEHGLDRALAVAIRDALQATGRFAFVGEPEAHAVPEGLDVRSRSDVGRWAEAHRTEERQATLVVGLRHGMPKTLAGVYGLADVWLILPRDLVEARDVAMPSAQRADYYTHHADGTPRKTALKPGAASQPGLVAHEPHHLGRHALFTTPVPLDELQRPPPALVESRIAAIHAEFDAPIEKQKDRDLRRDLKSQRKRELDAAPSWTPTGLTEHMRDAWVAPPGDAYPRLVEGAQRNLAQRIAAGLVAGD